MAPEPKVCDALRRYTIAETGEQVEAPCGVDATVEIRLRGAWHPRCREHIPYEMRSVARPL